jgi:hypothetical protein
MTIIYIYIKLLEIFRICIAPKLGASDACNFISIIIKFKNNT